MEVHGASADDKHVYGHAPLFMTSCPLGSLSTRSPESTRSGRS